jgi:predicted O-methyltransferase YrrM
MKLKRRTVADALRLPAVFFGLLGLLGIVLVVTVSAFREAGLVLAAMGAAGVAVLYGMYRLQDAVVTHLSLDVAQQVGGLAPLLSLSGREPLGPLGGSALSPAAAGRLVSLIAQERPRCIVELGSGSSTVLLAQTIAAMDIEASVVSIEHDPSFVEVINRHLQSIDSAGVASVVHVPIAEDGGAAAWYSTSEIEAFLPSSIDLLVVDGPPDVRGSGARARALPFLGSRLGAGSLVFVDDTDRSSERRMIDEWTRRDEMQLRILLCGVDHTVLLAE